MTMSIVDCEPTIRAGMDEQRHTINLVILFAESIGSAVPGDLDNNDAAEETIGQHNNLATEVLQNHHGQVIKTIRASVMAEFAVKGSESCWPGACSPYVVTTRGSTGTEQSP